jgi:hypothetical protein
MTDNDEKIEELIEALFGNKRKRSFFPVDRMNYAYNHWPMGCKGRISSSSMSLNPMEYFLTRRQWDPETVTNKEKRKTKQNPNPKALED